MVQRARSGRQLAIELPPELLQRLKAHAAASDRPVSALVRRWIEAGLSGGLEVGAPAPDPNGLTERVRALEAAVAALQQQQAATLRPTRSTEPSPAAPSEPLDLELDLGPSGPDPLGGGSTIPRMGDAPEGAITTVELAEQTGTNRKAWNNWARDKNPGAVRHHPEAGAWRLVGRVPTEAGGPPRAYWERA